MDKWCCMKCGKELEIITLKYGECRCCLDCKILYTIHGTGVNGSLFVAGAETLVLDSEGESR